MGNDPGNVCTSVDIGRKADVAGYGGKRRS